MGSDVNFDGIATAFEDEIYGSAKGQIRLSVLWADLLEGIPALADGGLRVLDAGGGAGRIAVRLGRLGHEVVLCEPSRDMLDRAEAAISDAGLTREVRTVHSSLQDLAGVLEDEIFDVITCHAVLEWLADPQDAIGRLAGQLDTAGLLSLMFYNRNASLLKSVLSGHFADALHELQAGPAPRGWGEGAIPLAEDTVRRWLSDRRLTVRSKAGIRIFHDHIPANALVGNHLGELLAVEQAVRHVEPFASLGQHIHLIAQSP
jgi:S-adenosylmethionine-dependent methyltransferase